MYKKKTTLQLIMILLLIIIFLGATYAYFVAQTGSGGNANIEVSSGTTDSLTFAAGDAITLSASADDFYQNAGDKTGSTSATAKLIPNNTTNEATDYYNVYFIIDENDFTYSTPDEQIELLLKVTNPEREPVTNIDALVYDSELQGFDITKRKGAFKISLNEEINATDSNGFSEEWQIEVILRNLEVDQQANTGKTFSGRLLITTGTEDTYIMPELNSINEVSKNYDSITVSLIESEEHTAPIDKYYYAIEETEEEPERASILSIAEKLEPTYEASDDSTYTFKDLMENQSYKIYAYAKDTQGISTDIKTAIIKTDDYTRISLTEVNISEVNHHGFKVTAAASAGTNNVKEYAFMIEDNDKYGEWSSWQEENEFTFTELKAGLNYKVQVKARDDANKETITSFDKEQTTTPYTVKVEVTNGNSEPPENQAIENAEVTFNITASEGYDITTAQVIEGNGCILSDDKGTLTVSNVTNDITCKIVIYQSIPINQFIISKVNTDVGAGLLTQHLPSLAYSAGDSSYRYSGDNPNNYVCFGKGSEAYNNGGTTCPDTNLYRIIGVFDNQVKLIKSEYITSEELGISKVGYSYYNSDFDKYNRTIKDSNKIDSFYWNQSSNEFNFGDYVAFNYWEKNNQKANLNEALNNNVYGYLHFLGNYETLIAEKEWYLGTDNNTIINEIPSKVFQTEFSGEKSSMQKIGIMYISEFAFAASNIDNLWQTNLSNYNSDNNRNNNWLYNAVNEWTIMRNGSNVNDAYIFNYDGGAFNYNQVYNYAYAVRPTFYLQENVKVKNDNALGDVNSPFRIVI